MEHLIINAIIIFIGIFILAFLVRMAACIFSAKIRQRVRKRWFLHTLWGVSILILPAAIAVPQYADYSDRAKVSEGIGSAAPAKLAVAEFHQSEGRFPVNNLEAGVNANSSSTYVESMIVGKSGIITVLFSLTSDLAEDALGKTVVLSPRVGEKYIEWDCTVGDMPAEHVPSSCR